MLFANTSTAKVEAGAVVATGTLAQMIAPASPFREGFPEARAASEFGVYPITSPTYDPATERLAPSAPYYDSEADAVFGQAVTALTLAERQAALHAPINPERERRWRASSPLAFDALGDGSVLVPVDIRSDEDLRNIQAITSTAQILGQINPSAQITFRGADNVSYALTPDQVVGLGLAVSAHINGFYAASWALKDSITAAESLAALADVDPLADQHWP